MKNQKTSEIFILFFLNFPRRKIQKNLGEIFFEIFFDFFKKYFFTFLFLPRKCRENGQEIIKIHQLEQILANVPMLVHCAPPPQ